MDPARRERLLRRLPCRATALRPLAPLTTFRIGGPAQILAEPDSVSETIELLRILAAEQVPRFYLGLGSNLLVSDRGFDGVVIHGGESLRRITGTDRQICAGPGARLLDLTAFAAAHSLSGIEALSGIPGTVGGGLYMNAGAYGSEIANTLVSVDIITPDLRTATLQRDEIGFGYRSAPALQSVVVMESRYALLPAQRSHVYGEMRRVWKLRRGNQPLEYPSAGSVFKRPVGDYAGRLVEAVGGKGMRVGGALVSPKHAGFIVNAGGATAEDAAELIRRIRKRVYDEFQVKLEPEIKAVGFAEDPFAVTF